MKCRHCNNKLEYNLIDLGFAPPSNAYLKRDGLLKPEIYYPLVVKVCDECWLVQTEDYTAADDLFKNDYAYFSSTSSLWLKHASEYVEKIIIDLKLNNNSYVVELASNDGYLLKNFVKKNIPCLGVEPTIDTANASKKLNIPVITEFFGKDLAKKIVDENKKANLIIGNNVYAHVPDINDFTRGIKLLLDKNGTVTLEFPHLLQLINFNQFDTIYHEHFSYLSLITVLRIFKSHGLNIWKVEKLKTHGGSLRIYGCHIDDERSIDSSVNEIIKEEEVNNLNNLKGYINFQMKAEKVKNHFIDFLIEQKKKNKVVVAYGAAAKGNTLLNFAGVKNDLISCVFDASPGKIDKFLPGSHIPIYSPDKLSQLNPDYIIIFPWNIAEEIINDFKYLKEKGSKFVTFIPSTKFY